MKFITTLSYFTMFISAFMFLRKLYFKLEYEVSLQQKLDRINGEHVRFKVKIEAIIFILSLYLILSM